MPRKKKNEEEPLPRYVWKDTWNLTPRMRSVGLSTLQECLNRVAREDGEITGEGIIRRARNRKDPLNKAYNWNGKVAVEELLKRDTAILLSSYVRVEIKNGKPQPRREYYNTVVVSHTTGRPRHVYERYHVLIEEPTKLTATVRQYTQNITGNFEALVPLLPEKLMKEFRPIIQRFVKRALTAAGRPPRRRKSG